MARAVLSGARHAMPPVARGPISHWVALGVHRDTALGGLVTALRLSFPTVDALVGPDFFDQTARAYVEHTAPVQARLSDYGAGFADFLQTYGPAAGLPYLPDAARFDRAIGDALAAPGDAVRRLVILDAQVSLSLPVSLTTLGVAYPVDLIRAAIDADDEVALAAIDLAPAARTVAVWRTERQAAVRALSRPAGRFLTSLLSGAALDDALADAFAAEAPQTALQAIQAEVFAGSFCRITKNTHEAAIP
jgi:hypothetical protein